MAATFNEADSKPVAADVRRRKFPVVPLVPPPHVGSYRLRFALIVLALLGGIMIGRAQYLEPPEPTLTAPRARYLRVDVEAEQSHQRSSIGASSSFQRIYVSPVIGFTWDYYIYHPDL